MVTGRLYSSSKEELPISLSCSSSLLFVLSLALQHVSFRINPGVDWLVGREVPLLLVVGVVRFWRPLAAYYSMETMSSGLALQRLDLPIQLLWFRLVGQLPVDALPIAELPVGLLELVLPPLLLELVFGRCGCCSSAWRSARISRNNFSILAL